MLQWATPGWEDTLLTADYPWHRLNYKTVFPGTEILMIKITTSNCYRVVFFTEKAESLYWYGFMFPYFTRPPALYESNRKAHSGRWVNILKLT